MVKMEFYAIEMVKDNQSFRKLKLFGRDDKRNKIIHTIEAPRPYFYILEEEKDKVNFYCDMHDGYVSMYGDKLTKIEIESPWDIYNLKQHFTKTFEADIQFPQRYLIDAKIFNAAEIQDDGSLKGIDFSATPRICNVDVEVDYPGGSNKEMLHPLICIGFHDSYTNKFYSLSVSPDGQTGSKTYRIQTPELKTDHEVEEIRCKDEKEMLLLFKQYVKTFDFDIFVGWNVFFDMIYILRRLEILNLGPEDLSPIKRVDYGTEYVNYGADKGKIYGRKEKKVMIRGKAIIDLLKSYKKIKWKQIPSFRLDLVAQAEFKSQKLAYSGWMGEFYRNDYEKFLRYNLRDIEISWAIDKKYSLVDAMLNIRKMSGCEVSDVLFNSRIIDVFMLRHCHDKFVLPTKKYKTKTEQEEEKAKNKIVGGFVLDPVPGIHENVCVLDLSALYPSIMLAGNFSPETIDVNGEIIVGNGIKFRKEPGMFKEILLSLVNERNRIRALLKTEEIYKDPLKYINLDRRQYFLKTTVNSLYGVQSYTNFRLYNPAISASITFVGRWINEKMRELCKELNYTVLLADTDSIIVNVKASNREEAIALGKKLESDINDSFKTWFAGTNFDTKYFSVKFEKLFGMLFCGTQKKMYAYTTVYDWERGVYSEPVMGIKGFSTVKSDRSYFSKKLQRHIFEMIFDRKSKEEINKFILSEIDKFYSMHYSFDEIGVPKTITKDLDEYTKNRNPWIVGVEYSLKNLKGFTFSPKPYLLYTIPSLKYQTENFCFNDSSEVQSDLSIDMQRMLETSAYKVVEKVVDVLGISSDDILAYITNKVNKQRTLGDFGITWQNL